MWHLSVQAIIMAGGEGVRLRPLTLNLPKPLVPLLGEPVMGYALKLLKMHGITDVGATLCYQPRKIRAAFGKGEKYGVKLKYFEETSPMGTAGSVRMAREQLKGTFLVLSGDGLTDCDLTRALSFHKEKKALATLVLRRVSVPLPYGVVMCDQENRITRFIEKPTWSRVFSDLVNTGIYILEPEIFDYIPETGTPDFGRDIFPALMEAGIPLYGFETTGYWCDVGDQRAYLSAQQALLRGEVALPHDQGIHETARVDASARIVGHCLIGRDAVIGPGAVIENAVIGERAAIGPGAVISDSCLWEKTVVQERASLSSCILCDGAVARKGAQIADGCALGQGAVAGAGAELRPGVRIWPHLKAVPGAVASRSIITADLTATQWTSRGADCDTAEGVCSLCMAFAKVTGAKLILVGRSAEAAALQSIAAGALGAAGVRVLTAGEMSESMLRTLIPALKASGGIYAQGQTLSFFDNQGIALPPRQLAAMDSCVLHQDAPPAFAREGGVIRFTGAEEIYLARVLPEGAGKPLFSPIAVFCDIAMLRRMAGDGLARLGAKDVRLAPTSDLALRPLETGFLIPERGEEAAIFTQQCTPGKEQRLMLLLSLCHRKNGVLFDLAGVPRAAAGIAPLCEPDDSPACLYQRSLLSDGIAALFALCEALKQGPLETLLQHLPETHILMRDVACRIRDKGRILHTLCHNTQLPHTLGEGVRIQHDRGYATIVPDAYRGLVRITSESRDSEFARELCDFYLDQIRQLTEENKSSFQMP